jgi:hypothetical protein
MPSQAQSPNRDSGVEQREVGDYRKDLKTFMKLSKSDDDQQVRNAIYNLCQLHTEIANDSRFQTSNQLPSFRAVLAQRLKKYSKDHKNEKLRNKRAKKKQSKKTEPKESSESNETLESDSGSSETSASNSSNSGDQTGSEGDYGDASQSNDDEIVSAMHDAAAESYYSLGVASGGPNQLFNFAGRMGPPWDHGDELVDLIVNVIDPAFWRRNGGNGSIHYYRPSQVLVISAPQQGHDAAADLLNKLRGANGNQMNLGGGLGGIKN